MVVELFARGFNATVAFHHIELAVIGKAFVIFGEIVTAFENIDEVISVSIGLTIDESPFWVDDIVVTKLPASRAAQPQVTACLPLVPLSQPGALRIHLKLANCA